MPESFTDRVEALFRSKPGTWIDGDQLAAIGGKYAWRSRVSDVRRERQMQIDNRQRKVGRITVSEYRYLPVRQGQAELFR